jgi:hypothetical protein
VILFIEPGSPWENGYVESFDGKMRDELLNGEVFDTLLEANVIVGQWVKQRFPHTPRWVKGSRRRRSWSGAGGPFDEEGTVTLRLVQRMGAGEWIQRDWLSVTPFLSHHARTVRPLAR